MADTPRSITVSTKRRWIAQMARAAPQMVFNNLSHFIDKDWMLEAYRDTRKNGAVGVDGITAKEYAANLESNLQTLINRAKSGTYYAPPVRRVHIPKGSGKETRPIGIPSFEDKVLQRAVTMILEAIYEEDFYDCSFGFRRGLSAHNALDMLWKKGMKMGGGWTLEIDIRKFFDTLDHTRLRTFLQKRVQDGVLLQLIGKWLNAGVMEDGRVSYPDAGSPQGGVISPILANVYLHEVLDTWFEETVKPRLKGQVFLIRYADDAVMVFSEESDARRVLDVLPKRFEKYGLALHPEKTRLVPFQQPRENTRTGDKINPPPGVFDLLGFTHFWGKSRKGTWVMKRKTAKSRFARALGKLTDWCRSNRHMPVQEQWKALSAKLRGHYGYYGITGNGPMLGNFLYAVRRGWQKWLSRRSGHGQHNWDKFEVLYQRYALPTPKIRPRPL